MPMLSPSFVHLALSLAVGLVTTSTLAVAAAEIRANLGSDFIVAWPRLVELLPRLPEKPLTAFALVLLFWFMREATFPLREKRIKGQVVLITGGGGGLGFVC